jgi:hypothetical protein
VVVRYADGTAAVAERDFGLGRVMQFSSTADTAWCDLPVRPAFLPLLHRALGALVQRQDEGLNVAVGEPFRRRVSLDYLGQDANITKPRQSEAVRDLRRVEMAPGGPVLQFPDTDYAGAYRATIEEPALDIQFSAQPDASESSLEELSADQIVTLKDVANVIEWSPDLEVRELVEQDRTGVEFWFPLMVAVLLLAGLETFLAQWFSRSK